VFFYREINNIACTVSRNSITIEFYILLPRPVVQAWFVMTLADPTSRVSITEEDEKRKNAGSYYQSFITRGIQSIFFIHLLL
jgi:hypothetical protein